MLENPWSLNPEISIKNLYRLYQIQEIARNYQVGHFYPRNAMLARSLRQ